MAALQGSSSIQVIEQSNRNFSESEVRRIEEAVQKLSQRGEPINILVIGPTGSGKSTLINALMGDTVAKEGAGAASVQSEVEVHQGKYEGITIKVYDTTGFSDTEGQSEAAIIRDIAKANKFDLILICMRMDSRADDKVRRMFDALGDMMNKEMWERSVVVLTFANIFLQLKNIKKLPNKSEAVRNEINEFKRYLHGFLRDKIKQEAINEIPFCIAGDEDERKLPTTDDWLKELWNQCVGRCSEDVGEFLSLIAKYRMLIEAGAISGTTAVELLMGGAIGGGVGSVIPVAGTITGAAVGAGIGAGLAIIITSIVIAITQKVKKSQSN